jgi:hypothetical protein
MRTFSDLEDASREKPRDELQCGPMGERGSDERYCKEDEPL